MLTAQTIQQAKLDAIADGMFHLSEEAQTRVLAAVVYEINRYTGDQLHYQDSYNFSHIAPKLWEILDPAISSEVYKMGARKELISSINDLRDHEGLA